MKKLKVELELTEELLGTASAVALGGRRAGLHDLGLDHLPHHVAVVGGVHLHGVRGADLADVLPHLAKVVDDVCFVRSVHTDQFNHAPAQIFFNTGFSQPGRPSLGSWVTYGLGAEASDLPAFVVMSTGAGISGGAANWSSGFLPTVYSGCRLRNQGDPILDVSSPAGIDPRLQRDSLDLIGTLNRRRLEQEGDPEIATRIASYEMAYRLQTSAPELMDLRSESKETLEMYGCEPDKPSFARACLLARRMIERGVRFINIYNEGWDAHSDVAGNLRNNCGKTDKASAALVTDLKRRGLLDETLVVWGGEFGRTPMVETNPALGRSHRLLHRPVGVAELDRVEVDHQQVVRSERADFVRVPADRPVAQDSCVGPLDLIGRHVGAVLRQDGSEQALVVSGQRGRRVGSHDRLGEGVWRDRWSRGGERHARRSQNENLPPTFSEEEATVAMR